MTWRTVALSDVAQLERAVVAPEAIAPGTRYLGLENIERGGTILGWQTVGETTVASAKFRFSSHHLLFGKLRPNLGKIARPDFEGVCSTDILPIAPGPELDRGFLAHFLSQQKMVDFAASRATGANLPRLSPSVLADFQVPLPPLSEQRRIAAILDQADSLRAKRRHTLALLDDLAQAVFLDILTRPEADRWPLAEVAEVASSRPNSIRTGPFGSQLLHSEFVESGVAVLGIDNAVTNEFRWAQRRYITEEKYRSLTRYTVHPGDVLITIMGTCGRCAVVPDDIPLSINTKHLCCITVNRERCLPEFLHASFLWQRLARRYLQRATKGAIMDGLNMGLIKAMPMVLPPIEVQRDWVNRLEAVTGFREIANASSMQLDEAFAAFQAAAFSGRLGHDLVDTRVQTTC